MAFPELDRGVRERGAATAERLAQLHHPPPDGRAAAARSRVWIVADEMPVLRRQSKLEASGRPRTQAGTCRVLGFQAITQLRSIYGTSRPRHWSAAPTTKLILRTGEPETAQWSSRPGRRARSKPRSAKPVQVSRAARQLQHPPATYDRKPLHGLRDPASQAASGLSVHHWPSPSAGNIPYICLQ